MNSNIVVYSSEEELYHFGVRGMRWGVRRASTSADVSKLSKKITTKVGDLDKNSRKLSEMASKYKPKIDKYTEKGQKFHEKYNKAEAHALTEFGYAKARSMQKKTAKAEHKATVYTKKVAKIEKKITNNENMKKLMNTTLKEINSEKFLVGKKAVDKFSR